MEITTEHGTLTLDPPTLAGEEIRIGDVTPLDPPEGGYTHVLAYTLASDLESTRHTTRLPRVSAMLIAGVRADTADPMTQEVWAGLLTAYLGPAASPGPVARACDRLVAELYLRGLVQAAHRVVMHRGGGAA